MGFVEVSTDGGATFSIAASFVGQFRRHAGSLISPLTQAGDQDSFPRGERLVERHTGPRPAAVHRGYRITSDDFTRSQTPSSATSSLVPVAQGTSITVCRIFTSQLASVRPYSQNRLRQPEHWRAAHREITLATEPAYVADVWRCRRGAPHSGRHDFTNGSVWASHRSPTHVPV